MSEHFKLERICLRVIYLIDNKQNIIDVIGEAIRNGWFSQFK